MKTRALKFTFSPPLLAAMLLLLAALFNPGLVKADNGAIADASALNKIVNQHEQPKLLDIDDAFQLKTQTDKQGHLVLDFEVAEGYHLYRDKIKAKVKTGSATLGALDLPHAISANDPVFGDVMVYHGAFQVRLPISNVGNDTTVEIRYQGCSVEAGVCYPPVKKKIALDPADFTTTSATANNATTSSAAETETQQPLSETDQIANNLETGSIWTIIGSFFLIGLLLSLTPCVFPMIPILSSIIVGQGDQLTTRRAFTMSLVYVLAMSVTYTLAGVFAGLFGENLQAHFQNPWVIGTFSLIFIMLAFSMFGFYELQLPSSVQSKLTNISNKQQGGTLTGVAVMGFLSALIVGPCMAPPLAGSLIYIGQTGDALLGGTALFAMSIGMGVPLLLLGTSAGKLLPRAGAWMDNVKAIFGVMMIGVAIWMAERILPEWITLAAWASLLIGSAIYLGALESTAGKSGWAKLGKSIGMILFIYGTVMFVGLAGGSNSYLQPLKVFQGSGSAGSSESHAELNFQKISTVDELNTEIAKGNPIMLDFYADWCISCKEMESFTFSDPAVQKALSNVTLLQADVTDNNANDKALMKALGIVGPPAIMFFNEGQEQKAQRVVGFQKPDVFLNNIQNAYK
ncbi:protein-disulfide reductase DsbD [Hydrogenovibrio sp. SC-1]|uniref:protein-disulfide reductase DsbD n=1 Tax=Hydrogenovibrio sp. SC-1 TaxID=2065820 RepID=UPI000C7D0AE9|nr:protein-disulfide reductase DsbD [Hydrogenovibrio sp. SC-1]PLA75046.1 protein-disulfide reductase DsbD [Hydrogenovibrio sp. SC-1]